MRIDDDWTYEEYKDNFGIEMVLNELSPVELVEHGYRKMDATEVCYLEPLFQLVPQLVVDKAKNAAVQKAFEEATKNTYKCILDPSKHLAIIRGTSDVYIGSALDNSTNQLAGQAKWQINDAVLSVSNVPQHILNVFNVLSVVTGQYFMAQINANLSDIKNGIVDIRQYLDDIKQSELETALQDLNEILNHLHFIKKNPERVRNTIVQLDSIRAVSKDGINLHKKQIEGIMRNASVSDDDVTIRNNTEKMQKHVVQYRNAVHVYNLAQILKIYLNNITDTEELLLYRAELSAIANQYKNTFSKATGWVKKYLDESTALNKENKKQIILSLGSGIVPGVLGGRYSNYKLVGQTTSLVNDLFDNNRRKKKDKYVLIHEEYQNQMNDMTIIDSSISAMDKYIAMREKIVEIVSVDGDCYIKYLDKN